MFSGDVQRTRAGLRLLVLLWFLAGTASEGRAQHADSGDALAKGATGQSDQSLDSADVSSISPVLNALPEPEPFLPAWMREIAREDPVPDTTAPWRYYPLQKGNVWEYRSFDHNGDCQNCGVLRKHISEDSVVIDGTRWAQLDYQPFTADGTPTTGVTFLVRFDTTSARIRQRHQEGWETVHHDAPCPFGMPWNTDVECFWGETFHVIGGHDGSLVFDVDTLHDITWVHYFGTIAEDFTYAADFGWVRYLLWENEWTGRRLVAAKIDGRQYGTLQHPVSAEVIPPVLAHWLSAYPNPSRGSITLEFGIEEPGHARIQIVDLLGRVVREIDVEGHAGQHEKALDLSSLSPGIYLAVLHQRAGSRTTRFTLL